MHTALKEQDCKSLAFYASTKDRVYEPIIYKTN